MLNYDIFDSDFRARNQGHFASIVRVALSDGEISDEEMHFINILKEKLDISDEDYKKIIENPNNYPVNPPYLQTQRIERLYDLARMVYVNHVLGPKQKDILRRFTSALGFSGDVNKLTDKALSLLVLEVDFDTFMHEIEEFTKLENSKEVS